MGFGVWIWKAQKGLGDALRVNRLWPAGELPVKIEDLLEKVLGSSRIGTPYCGNSDGPWDPDTRLVPVDTGSDDPWIYALTLTVDSPRGIDFAIVQTIGVRRTSGLVGLLEKLVPRFADAGLELLPDDLQPHLSRRRGLLVYAEPGDKPEGFPPRDLLNRLADARCDARSLDRICEAGASALRAGPGRPSGDGNMSS
jgi:hypothetical protein